MRFLLTIFGIVLLIICPTLNIIHNHSCNHFLQREHRVFLDLQELDFDAIKYPDKNPMSVLRINLELQNQEDKEKIISLMPKVKQSLIMCILGLENSDLIGSSDLYRIRKDALTKINKIAYPILVQNVLFNRLSRS